MMSDLLFDSKRDKANQHEMYCIELLRRVTLQGDQEAWQTVQELLSETVRGWISQHPRREEACSLESEEYYVTQAFARFYLLANSQQVEFSQLSTALQYLRVSLNGAILDRLRTFSRPRVIPLSTPDDAGDVVKPTIAQSTDTIIVWKILRESFPNARDQRLAYLLFHCGLNPNSGVRKH